MRADYKSARAGSLVTLTLFIIIDGLLTTDNLVPHMVSILQMYFTNVI